MNYFFHYYTVSEDEENDNLRSLRGEAHFLRAYWHFYLLKRFGNIPLMDAFWDENATIEGLQIPQKPRNEVAKFILQDLTTAKGLLHGRSEYKGLRINKEAAMILAMNVALYEGSWEKYHANDAFAAQTNESEYFFNQVITWGDELFQAGITLNTKDTDPFGATTPCRRVCAHVQPEGLQQCARSRFLEEIFDGRRCIQQRSSLIGWRHR